MAQPNTHATQTRKGRADGVGDRLVVIHFGAHRTGTTYLQSVFRNNAAFLADHGIQYRCLFGVAPVREAFIASRRAATSPDEAEFDRRFSVVEEYISRLLQEYPTDDLLISYEGILGGLAKPVDGGFYRHHQLCLSRFMKIFEGERVHGLFAIREYGSFLDSCYAKLVQAGHTPRVKRTPPVQVSADVSWLPIVGALHSALGPNLSLFTYEDFAKSERRLLEWFFRRTFGLDVESLELIQERVNPSPSSLTLGAMRLVNKLVPSPVGRLRTRINRHLLSFPARKSENSKVLSKSARRALKQRYATDLHILRREIPGMYDPPG